MDPTIFQSPLQHLAQGSMTAQAGGNRRESNT